MLVVSRMASNNPDESDLEIECPDGTLLNIGIVKVEGRKVSLGIKAPLSYHIRRRDCIDRSMKERGDVERPL